MATMTTKSELLPDSRPKVVKSQKWHKGAFWTPIFCANCGIPGGYVPEENCSFACWLCDLCAETYGTVAGTMMMPDEVFWKKVEEAQLEQYGRVLSTLELVQVANDESSSLSTLLKESI